LQESSSQSSYLKIDRDSQPEDLKQILEDAKVHYKLAISQCKAIS
jgi:hypothetical protein